MQLDSCKFVASHGLGRSCKQNQSKQETQDGQGPPSCGNGSSFYSVLRPGSATADPQAGGGAAAVGTQ